MVTALLLMTVTRQLIEPQCIRTNQTFHHKFSVFECMKIVQNYAQVSLPLSHTIQYSKMLIVFAERHFFIRKMKIKMDFVISMLKVVESSVICDIWNSSLPKMWCACLIGGKSSLWPTVRNMCFQKL